MKIKILSFKHCHLDHKMSSGPSKSSNKARRSHKIHKMEKNPKKWEVATSKGRHSSFSMLRESSMAPRLPHVAPSTPRDAEKTCLPEHQNYKQERRQATSFLKIQSEETEIPSINLTRQQRRWSELLRRQVTSTPSGFATKHVAPIRKSINTPSLHTLQQTDACLLTQRLWNSVVATRARKAPPARGEPPSRHDTWRCSLLLSLIHPGRSGHGLSRPFLHCRGSSGWWKRWSCRGANS